MVLRSRFMDHFPPRRSEDMYGLLRVLQRQHCNGLGQTFTDWQKGKTRVQEFKGNCTPRLWTHACCTPRRLSCLLSASFATDTMWVAPFGKGILEYGSQRRTPARRITGMRMNTLSTEGWNTLSAERRDLYVLCLSILPLRLLNNEERHLREQFTSAVDDRVSWYHWKGEKQQTPRESIQAKIPNYKSSFPSWPLLVLNRRGKRRCYAVRSLLRGSPLTSPFSSGETTLSLPLLSPPRIALVLSIPRPFLPWPTAGHNQVGNPSP